jgi:hypothetical protein
MTALARPLQRLRAAAAWTVANRSRRQRRSDCYVVAMFRVVVMIALLALSTPAIAEPRHTVSVEALGKGGLWGLGYDYQLRHRIGVGAVGSYYQLAGDHYLTFSPYLSAYPIRGKHAGWFAQLGPQLLHHATPSPVPEWQGMSTTTVAGELSTGFEYRAHVVVRVYAMVSVGDQVAPWAGASIGWTL